jgi:hypothetical protein
MANPLAQIASCNINKSEISENIEKKLENSIRAVI